MAAPEELDYESDPEEAKLSLKMRRRVASDDEDEGEGREKPLRRIDSDGESDGQGAAPGDYDDEEEDEEEYLEEEQELEDEEGEYEEEGLEHRHEHEGDGEREAEGCGLGGSQEGEKVVKEEGGKEGVVERLGRAEELTETDGRGINDGVNEKVDDGISNEQQREEEKKENEPYAVPTAGAFYMHDDRFRDNAGGRHRRTLGGRKLWESKDERKWGHDKFEELTSQEKHFDEGRRSSRGRFRGRGKSRGALRGYSQGTRPKTYGNNNNQINNNDQNNAPKSVRGRGPRRYQPSFKNNNDAPPSQNKQYGKSVEKPSRASSGRATVSISDVVSSTAPAKKQLFASSLNSASPPFYPSSSSNKDITSTQKRDVQAGTSNRNVQAPVADESFPAAQSNAMMRGKNIVDAIGMEKLYIETSTSGVAEKPSINSQFAPSGSSSVNLSESRHLRAQGRGLNAIPRTTYQPTAAGNQANRVSPPNQLHAVQRNPAQSRAQPSLQASSQQFAQHLVSGSQASSPPKAAMPINSLESGELESPSELSKSKTALAGKGKVNVQGSGRGLFLYGGNQVMGPSGNVSTGHGDQNFPAFLPVMQLGGQHPGGIEVPAFGMAFPGYVGNPQLGLGNSEMTWLPVLAGAAGALGATYCSPYFAVDGAYNARPSGQTSAVTASSSKENNANKPNNEWKLSQRPEVANDDFGLRQKNPRRYTEMKFDQ